MPGEAEKEEEEDEEDDGDLLGGFEKDLEAIVLPREQMAQLKEEVKTEMEKEFDNIISEVCVTALGPPARMGPLAELGPPGQDGDPPTLFVPPKGGGQAGDRGAEGGV